MTSKLKWRPILLLGLALLLASSFVGCGGINSETYSYLAKMQEWQDKWDEKWLGGNLVELDDLVDELEAIEVPGEPIPLEFDGRAIDYWTFSDHSEYIFAHRQWVFVEGHMNRMQELEEQRYIAMGSDEVPSCSVALEYGEGSAEYKEACWLVKQATEHLGFVEARLPYLFAVYLSE